jgi:signal transduction histidine kinase
MKLPAPLRRLDSVGAKVSWIVVLASAVAVLGVAITAGASTYAGLKRQRGETVASQSRVIAVNAGAALAFGDTEMATELLSAFRVVDGVQRAVLYDVRDRPFAAYPARPTNSIVPLTAPPRHGRLLSVPVTDRAGVHGRLQVEVRDVGLRREAMLTALQTAGVSLAAIVLAWLLGRGLQPLLTDPILQLDRAMKRVRDTGDYSRRVERSSDDELGRLTDAFNEMLDRIERSRAELLEAQRRAEESSRLKDEFVATVSHELRTPLSPILAWIQMLRLPQGASNLQGGLDVMDRNARALVGIIDDLLDMSRIVSGTLRLNMQPVDLASVIAAAVETLTPTAHARGVRVEVALAPLPPLLGDPARLQQVVWNLLSNAIKFTASGQCVRVSARVDGAHVSLRVTDEGLGIEPAFLPYVFDRFRQQDGSITRRHGGLGLGLAIVRQLVELHGGEVDAHSDGPGRGASFEIRLPVPEDALVAAPRRTAAPTATATSRVLDGVRVLLVEDHADMREAMTAMLAAAGAQVRGTANAGDALAAFAERTPDVLVSDIGLPDIDGYALLQQLRATQPASAAVPAIAVSAYVRPLERDRAHEAGYALHLPKPVDADTLVGAVASLLPR